MNATCQITQVMGAVFLFTLLSGFAVLYAALLATQDERIFEAAVLRTLGAPYSDEEIANGVKYMAGKSK